MATLGVKGSYGTTNVPGGTSTLPIEDRKKYSKSDLYIFRDYAGAKLLSILTKKLQRKPVNTSQFKMFEDDYPQMSCTITGNSAAGAAAALTTTVAYLGIPNAGRFLQAGDVLHIPKTQATQTNSSMALHGEDIEIISVHGDTDTPANDYVEVKRDTGGVGASYRATAASAATLYAYKMSRGQREGSDAPDSFANAMEAFTQNIQIDRETISMTGSAEAEVNWGPKNQRQWERNKKLKVILRRMERTVMLGQRSTVQESGQPKYKQGGFLWWMNNGDGAGVSWSSTLDLVKALDEVALEDRSRVWYVGDNTPTNWGEKLIFKYIQNAFIKGSNNKIGFCGDGLLYQFNMLFAKYIRVENDPKFFGLEVMKFITPMGTWNLMRNLELTLSGYTNTCLTVDLDYAGYRYKSGNGKNRDLRLRTDIQAKKTDGIEDEWTADFAIDLKFREAHSAIIGNF